MRKAFLKTPKRLTEDDHVVIAAMYKAGDRQCKIAKIIHFPPSTVSKELSRNHCDDGGYRTMPEQAKTGGRKKRAPYKLKGWLQK